MARDARGGRPFDPTLGDWLPDAAPPWTTDPSNPSANASWTRPPAGQAPASAPPTPEDEVRGGRATFWNVVMLLDLVAIGLLLLNSLAAAFILWLDPGGELAREARGAGNDPAWLLLTAVTLLALFAVVPAAWVAGTRRTPWTGMVRYLGLQQPGKGLLLGAGLGVLTLVAVWVAILAYVAAYAALNDVSFAQAARSNASPVTEGIVTALSIPLAALLAVSAGVGEEVFFRGILQRRVGLWGQAALFGLFHLGYGTVLQAVLPFAIGILFGVVYKRTGNLWIVIAAHTLFDGAQLAIAMSA